MTSIHNTTSSKTVSIMHTFYFEWREDFCASILIHVEIVFGQHENRLLRNIATDTWNRIFLLLKVLFLSQWQLKKQMNFPSFLNIFPAYFTDGTFSILFFNEVVRDIIIHRTLSKLLIIYLEKMFIVYLKLFKVSWIMHV